MIYDLMIIGGGPAGLSAGLYAARARLSAAVLTDGGGQVTSTSEIENYLGIENIDGFELDRLFTEHAVKMGAKIIRGRAEALSDGGEIKTIKTRDGELSARAVILAMGATHRELGLESERRLFGSGVSYCATCDGAFFRNKDVFVIGGGFTAAEESVFLTKFARHVTMLIRKNDFACPASVADKARNHEKITVLFNTVVQEVSGDDGLRRIQYQNTTTGEITEYQSPDGETIGVFVFAGYAPDTALVSGIAERDARGYIITDENQKTSVEGLYAAGDICVKPLRQVITAASDGAVAAAALEKYCGALRGESCI